MGGWLKSKFEYNKKEREKIGIRERKKGIRWKIKSMAIKNGRAVDWCPCKTKNE